MSRTYRRWPNRLFASARRVGVKTRYCASPFLGARVNQHGYQDGALLPCYDHDKIVLTPRRHPLLKAQPLTLAALAAVPVDNL